MALDAELEAGLEWISHPAVFGSRPHAKLSYRLLVSSARSAATASVQLPSLSGHLESLASGDSRSEVETGVKLVTKALWKSETPSRISFQHTLQRHPISSRCIDAATNNDYSLDEVSTFRCIYVLLRTFLCIQTSCIITNQNYDRVKRGFICGRKAVQSFCK